MHKMWINILNFSFFSSTALFIFLSWRLTQLGRKLGLVNSTHLIMFAFNSCISAIQVFAFFDIGRSFFMEKVNKYIDFLFIY